MRRLALLLTALWLLLTPAMAQEDDKGFLVNLLQDNLSGAGRSVQIDGFEGVLSSRATLERMTIADDQGVWLVLENVALDWNRRALLRGRLEVTELSAERLSIARAPQSEEDALPAAEASEFALPDLLVSVDLAAFRVEVLSLGAPLLGEPADLRLTASAALDGGSGFVKLDAERLDGQTGAFTVDGAFEAGTEELTLNLDLREGEAGLIAKLVDLPGAPDLSLTVAGAGPLSDFAADIRLATRNTERLAGKVTLSQNDDGRRFDADLAGDLSSLFLPQYQAFFGTDAQLRASGQALNDGAFQLDDFALKTQALDIAGRAHLDASGWPSLLDITGVVGAEDRSPVTLPISGPRTEVERLDLDVQFDVADGDSFTARFNLDGLSRPDLTLTRAEVAASGTLQGASGSVGRVSADVDLNANGLALSDAAVAQAAGSEVQGALSMLYEPGAPLRLSGINISAGDLAVTGDVDVDGLDAGFETQLDLALDAQDLSRFAALTGQKLRGRAAFDLEGDLALGGVFDLKLSGTGDALEIGQEQADAILAGQTKLDLDVARDTTGTVLRQANISNPQIELDASGSIATGTADLTYRAELADAALLTPELDGPLTLDGTAKQAGEVWTVVADAAGPLDATAKLTAQLDGAQADIAFNAELPDTSKISPQLSGPLALDAQAKQSQSGWQVDADASGPFDVTANVTGEIGDVTQFDYRASLPDASALTPQLKGPLDLSGRATQRGTAWDVTADASGPFDGRAKIKATLDGADVTADLIAKLPDVSVLAPQLTGALDLTAQAAQRGGIWDVTAQARGPLDGQADVTARIEGEQIAADFAASLPNIAPLAPQFPGAASVKGRAETQGEGWELDVDAQGPSGVTAMVDGTYLAGSSVFDFAARLPNTGAFVPNINGPLEVTGNAREAASGWALQTSGTGPAGMQFQSAGTVSNDARLDVTLNGQTPLSLANPFLAPRTIQGNARFDLALRGAPELSSLSGTVQSTGARLSLPSLRAALTDLNTRVDLQNGRANLDLSASMSSGGTLRVAGPVTLSGRYPAQLEIALNRFGLVDPQLYKTVLDGAIAIRGALLGGAQVSGRIDLGQTDISVPSSGLSTLGEIPEITHIRSPRPVQRSRARAGLNAPKASQDRAQTTGPVYPLDIAVSAPSRIFVRGRGLDAELAGAVKITGTSANPITAGQFELLRGRLDILGKRFALDEGTVKLQGSTDPILRFVATTELADGTASIVIDGPVSAPVVSFEANPPAPEDEVLARIFFGRSASQLSPFQALQLASAVASLAGRGGEGVISKLRGGLDLDDLDVTTDTDGNTAVRAGKYLSENVYTDVTIGTGGTGAVSLNLDISESVTARGKLQSDGDTSLGIFFERDY